MSANQLPAILKINQQKLAEESFSQFCVNFDIKAKTLSSSRYSFHNVLNRFGARKLKFLIILAVTVFNFFVLNIASEVKTEIWKFV